MIIVNWNLSGQIIHIKLNARSLTLPSFSVGNLISFSIIALLCGVTVFWLITHFPPYTIVGQVILFGSMLSMLVLGMIKPEVGLAIFFMLYPFLMFAEARLGFAWSWLGWLIPNMPEWLQTTLFGLENINVVLLMFTIGFLFFRMSHVKQIGKTMLDKPIILFLIWTSISVITANDSLEGLRSFFIKWIFPVSIYYATFFAIKRTNGIREIKLALMVLFFFSCLLTIQHAALVEEIRFETGERAKVWAVIAGQMGPWTVLTLPLVVSFLFDRRESVHIRLLSVFIIVLSLVMTIWEMQRSVMLSLVFMFVLGFFFYRYKLRWYLVLLGTFGIIGFFSFDRIMELINLVRPSLLQDNPFAYSVNLDRLYLFEKGWDIVKDNPLLGIGPGGFQLLHIGLRYPEVSSHNMLLEVALESGVIASVLFAAILFTPIIKFAISFTKGTNRTYDHDLRPWIISLLLFHVFLIFSTSWVWGYGAAVFCMLGVVVGTMRKTEGQAISA